MEPESLGPPPEFEVVPIRRSARIVKPSQRLCLNVECEETILGDLDEPSSYRVAMNSLEKENGDLL